MLGLEGHVAARGRAIRASAAGLGAKRLQGVGVNDARLAGAALLAATTLLD